MLGPGGVEGVFFLCIQFPCLPGVLPHNCATMVKSFVSVLVRNRKIHFLVFISAFFALAFHTLGRQGITVEYSTLDPHSGELTYDTVSQTIKNGLVVSDVKVQRCLRGFACSAPQDRLPSFWVKIPTKLNLYPLKAHPFNYYMYVEKTALNDSPRFVLDVQFTVKNAEPLTPEGEAKWMSHKIASNSYLWVKYLENMDFAAPVVRDVNVLFGKHDMIDARQHWKFSPAPVLLPLKQDIHPKISLLTVAVNDEMLIFNADQEFDSVLKKNEMIVTVDPKFKVLQISDMHVGQDSAKCVGDDCKFDMRTLNFIKEVISHENDVSFVMFTGDLIDFSRARHFESAILKALAPVLLARIPFVFTFGDSEHEWSNPQTKVNILNFVASLPGCYNKKPSRLNHRIHGLTNGNIKVYRVPPSGSAASFDYNKLKLEEPSAVLTYLDSEQMYVDETQSNYLYRLKNQMPAVDLKMLFFHNPLPNFRPVGKFKLIGSYNEKHKLHTLSSKEFLSDVKKCGYRAVCVGHEHENDSCIWDESDDQTALLCFSGVAGESADTRLDKNFERRLRVFDINFDKKEIVSWKRKSGDNKVVDPQQIWKSKDDLPEFAVADDKAGKGKEGEELAAEVPANKPVDKPVAKPAKGGANKPLAKPAGIQADKPVQEQKPPQEKPEEVKEDSKNDDESNKKQDDESKQKGDKEEKPAA